MSLVDLKICPQFFDTLSLAEFENWSAVLLSCRVGETLLINFQQKENCRRLGKLPRLGYKISASQYSNSPSVSVSVSLHLCLCLCPSLSHHLLWKKPGLPMRQFWEGWSSLPHPEDNQTAQWSGSQGTELGPWANSHVSKPLCKRIHQPQSRLQMSSALANVLTTTLGETLYLSSFTL